MEAHDGDRGGVDRVLAQEALDRFGVAVRDHALGEGQHARTRVAVLQRGGLGQGAAQQGPIGVGIGIGRGRAKGEDGLAVRFDESDVHPVHRGAGHEPYGAIYGQNPAPLFAAPETSA